MHKFKAYLRNETGINLELWPELPIPSVKKLFSSLFSRFEMALNQPSAFDNFLGFQDSHCHKFLPLGNLLYKNCKKLRI